MMSIRSAQLREFIVLVACAGIVAFVTTVVSGAQDDGGPPVQKACPNERAMSHLVGPPSSTPTTSTCSDGSPCGYVTTWGYSHWSCVEGEDTKCVNDANAAQVQSQTFSCQVDPDDPWGKKTICVGTTKTLSTMAGKKTQSCN
jgi:hypothetical protein